MDQQPLEGMMGIRAMTIAAWACLGSMLPCQVVIPSSLQGREGNDRVWVPGRYAPARAQHLYTASELPPTPFIVGHLALRRDGLILAAFEDHTVDVEVWLGPLNGTPLTGNSTIWQDNRSSGWSQAMWRRSVRFPADPLLLTPPANFTVGFPMDLPYTHQAGGMIVEWRLHAPQDSTWMWYADAEADSAWTGWPSGWMKTYYHPPLWWGHAEVQTPHLGSRLLAWGEINWSPWWLNPTAYTFAIIGQNDKSIGRIPLPFFIPRYYGDTSGAWLLTDALVMVPKIVPYQPGSAGSFYQPVEFDFGFIPNDQALVGMIFNFQMFSVLLKIDNSPPVIESTTMVRCGVGGGLTGTPRVFTFYNYHDPLLDQGARYYAAKAVVLEIR